MSALQTATRRWLGQNIKGTPAMRSRAVRHDLRKLRARCDAFGLQEFKWRWYWAGLNLLLARLRWHTYPSHAAGLAHPIQGGQAIGWRSKLWRAAGKRQLLLMQGVAGISDDRWIRAVLLVDKATGLAAWHMSTHFVVGGDRPTDSSRRKAMLHDNVSKLAHFLGQLRATGQPILGELDGNIAPGTVQYARLRAIVMSELGGTFHGQLGVEYTFTIPGAADDVIVEDVWTVPTSELRTDHEGRGLTYRIRRVRPHQLP